METEQTRSKCCLSVSDPLESNFLKQNSIIEYVLDEREHVLASFLDNNVKISLILEFLSDLEIDQHIR